MRLTNLRSHLRSLVVLASVAMPLAGATAFSSGAIAADTAPSAELKALAATITTMGYTVKYSPSGQHFYIQGNDKNSDTIDFALSTNKSYVWVYSNLATYTAAQMEHLPMLKLLQANDSNEEFFSMSSDGGTNDLYLQIGFPAVAVSPPVLRTIIDNLTSTANNNAALWDATLWK
jgi:hypothetical protein